MDSPPDARTTMKSRLSRKQPAGPCRISAGERRKNEVKFVKCKFTVLRSKSHSKGEALAIMLIN